MKNLKSFKIYLDNKILDYRQSEKLDLNKIRFFFSKKYQIIKLWKEQRHILGVLIKDNETYFLKLSTSDGISLITKNEYNWNNYFNKFNLDNSFLAPKNYDSGMYENKYFYLITEHFEGDLLCNINSSKTETKKLIYYISQIIKLAETIQNLPPADLPLAEYEEKDYKIRFINKIRGWFEDIPVSVIKKYKVSDLLVVVEKGADRLDSKPRHGDFIPWHVIKLKNGKLGLIDGEHGLPDGVENYDICYFIQRVFSVLKSPEIAREIYAELISKSYDKDKLKIVLSSRAIGGFLDESLNSNPNYKFAEDFKDWVLTI